MGFNTAQELAAILDLEGSIKMHLQANHYPPVPVEMTQACIDAIDAYHDEDYDRLIDMPIIDGFQVLYKNDTKAPAWAIVEQHHLSAWLPHTWDCTCDECLDLRTLDDGVEY